MGLPPVTKHRGSSLGELVEEIVKGRFDRALFVVIIGEEYRSKINKVALPHFTKYCEKYGLGFLVITDYVNPAHATLKPYNIDPGYQRLLAPRLIQEQFPQYTFLCDIDADCIPSVFGRNIFESSTLRQGTINLVRPTPSSASRQSLGRKISLLRRSFQDPNCPLDSLLAGSDQDEKRILGFDFEGPIATIGTAVGHVDDLQRSGVDLYRAIEEEFSGYLQNYRNKVYTNEFKVNYLPYSFQAIWNFELAEHYPFLYFTDSSDIAIECLKATLLRVDMLHFAGRWPENNLFYSGPFLFEDENNLFYTKIKSYLNEELDIKSYGRLNTTNK